MQAEHLKGWLAPVKRREREEAETKKEHHTEERTTEGLDGTESEETMESRRHTPMEASHW